MKNSTVYTDPKGDYIVVSRDLEGNEHRVYITYLDKEKNNGN